MKKLSESVWTDMQKRSTGDSVRMEDTIRTNIKDISPVDIGVSVLWADKDLEINGDTFVYIDQVKGFEKDGWRLPSQKEADELLTAAEWISTKDPHSWNRFYQIGITHMPKVSKDNTVYFECEIGKYSKYWENKRNANTGQENWDAFDFKQDGDFFPHSAYSIAHIEKDKCRVRLVKDK